MVVLLSGKDALQKALSCDSDDDLAEVLSKLALQTVSNISVNIYMSLLFILIARLSF